MPSKEEPIGKNEHKYLIRFSRAEWQRHTKLQEEYGFTTFSKLIRRALDVVGQSPSLLHEFKVDEERVEERMSEVLENLREQMGGSQIAQEKENRWKADMSKKLDILMKFMADTPKKKRALKKALDEIDDVEVVFGD